MKTKASSRGKRSVAIAIASSGVAMTLAGVFLGRGRTQELPLLELRIFMLVAGFSLALAGLVGIAVTLRAPREDEGVSS